MELSETFSDVTLKIVYFIWDFPGGPVVKTLHFCSMGLIPGQGTKIPHAVRHGLSK